MLFLNELSEDIYHTNINHQEQYKHQQNNNHVLNIKSNTWTQRLDEQVPSSVKVDDGVQTSKKGP